MWLNHPVERIDLKINKALIKAKNAISRYQFNTLNKAVGVNAAGQIAIEADIVSEDNFIRTLISEQVNGVLYSEESGVKEIGNPSEDKESSFIFLLDPLDGSHNYKNRVPIGCISLAYGKYKENPTLGDLDKAYILNLYGEDLFFSSNDSGSWFNGDQLTYTKFDDQNGIKMSYYAYGKNSRNYYLDFMNNDTYTVRSLGSAAWELAMVAINTNDIFADIRGVLKTHDFAAAKIILQNIGYDFQFINNSLQSKNIPLDDFKTGYSVIASRDKKLSNSIVTQFNSTQNI
ncbi:MAG: hypothetical protein OEZ01_00200 [Candidatus Heimdallarchaeota archaeon]|nr:hypothetical protein [Candidatus Heimdallarchaeota archaeon]MDH5644392.1 hypothetical protein [Candidatus Heimdallarchaeota archaeon]